MSCASARKPKRNGTRSGRRSNDPQPVQEETGRTAGQNPHVPSARLHGSQNRYKIKLWTVGYRLVYEVRDAELVVSVIAVGKRDRKGLRI